MSDKDVLDRARLLFIDDTQGDMLAREVIAIAERAMQEAAALTAQQDAQWEQVQADSASPYSYAVTDRKETELADSANPARQTGPYQYVVATKAKPRR